MIVNKIDFTPKTSRAIRPSSQSFTGKYMPELLSKFKNEKKVYNIPGDKFMLTSGNGLPNLTTFKFNTASCKLNEIVEIIGNKINRYKVNFDRTIAEIAKSENRNGDFFKRISTYNKEGNIEKIEFLKNEIKTRTITMQRKNGKLASMKNYSYQDDGKTLSELDFYDLSVGKRIRRLHIDYLNSEKDKAATVFSDSGKMLFYTNPEDALEIHKSLLLGL